MRFQRLIAYMFIACMLAGIFLVITPSHTSAHVAVPNCSGALSADSGAGTNPGHSLGIHVSWTCAGSGAYLKAFWGDGTSGTWCCASGPNFSGIFYHTWNNSGYYTVRWELWNIDAGGGHYHEATAYTYVSIH